MGNLDGLRVQVDELKQRLSDSHAERQSESGELKTRLDSIKAAMDAKQGEIDRLTAENEQLQGMLKDVLTAIDSQKSQAAGDLLHDFFAETAALVEPAKGGQPTQGPAPKVVSGTGGQPAAKATPDQQGNPQQDSAQQDSAPAEDEELVDLEDSPALRRIMRRGRTGR